MQVHEPVEVDERAAAVAAQEREGQGSEIPSGHRHGVFDGRGEQLTVDGRRSPSLGPGDHGVEEVTQLPKAADARPALLDEGCELAVEVREILVVAL